MTTSHPLEGIGLAVRNFKSFGEEGGSLGEVKPINIIIGRNNTGKSALIDAIELCMSQGKSFDFQRHARRDAAHSVTVSQRLTEATLKQVYREDHGGGDIPGRNHWQHGKNFVGHKLVRIIGPAWPDPSSIAVDAPGIAPLPRGQRLEHLVKQCGWPFSDLMLMKIDAERSVIPEAKDTSLRLHPDGTGTTNLIRAFLVSDSLPNREVEVGLLSDLNKIYQGDSLFTRINCQEGDGNLWEIFLSEEIKGDIRLSQSGSSLQSVFITLCMLRLLPLIEKANWKRTILAIEEPENNLHPALLRRLLNFLAECRDEKGFTLIVTTHSPIGIDWSSRRSDSQIIHVQHNGQSAKSSSVINYLQGRDILDDLDVRASDILQANGIIWVEGPTERIYLRRWIELFSGGVLKEGVHYTIMFYGGRLLSHLDALPLEESEELISLLRINRHAAVLIDSDRQPRKVGKQKPRMNLNKTKTRVRDEIEAIGGFTWITEGREIENYTPVHVYARVTGKVAPKTIDQYTKLPEHPFLSEFRKDKVAIAHAVAPETKLEDITSHLDLYHQLEKLCAHIRDWNGMS